MPFQTANGTVILSPENQQFVRGVTPPEVLILKELHFQFSNGTPLGPDWVINPEPAVTVEAEGKPAEEAYFDQNRGRHIDAKPAVPAKTHVRTNTEEAARLRKRYTGNISKNGVSLPAFAAVFGTAPNVKLPETFDEIKEAVGIDFNATPQLQQAEVNQRAFELSKLQRPLLCEMALGLKLKIAANDSKEFIIAAIINAEAKAKEKAEEKPTE